MIHVVYLIHKWTTQLDTVYMLILTVDLNDRHAVFYNNQVQDYQHFRFLHLHIPRQPLKLSQLAGLFQYQHRLRA